VHTSPFFKVFPPPKFLFTPHAGIDISDDAIRFIQYVNRGGSLSISKYGCVKLPIGLVESGDIKDSDKLCGILADFVRAHGLSYAKISIPEEKAYLFETEVPNGDQLSISQNIEFKLEQNIPLSAADAVFAFDILPKAAGKPLYASVSAVPKSYIERMIQLLRKAGITPTSFETTPRAIARVVSGASIVIHCMERKTGVYVVSEQAVGFTSTISDGTAASDLSAHVEALATETRRVYTYWLSKNGPADVPVNHVVVAGTDVDRIAELLRPKVADIMEVEVADVWQGIFNVSHYVPPISRKESPEYISAAGLAM
jgi:hypothetical protein